MRDTPTSWRWSTSVVLIIANAAVYLLILIALQSRQPFVRDFIERLALDPRALARGHVWQLLTFQFLHAGTLHLLLNCAMLYMFGRPLETAMSRSAFLNLYFGSGVCGGLVQAVGAWLLPHQFGVGPVVGASAGVFGLIAAFAWLNRETSVTMLLGFIIPVSIKAKYLLLAEVVLAVLGLLSGESGIAHGSHLGGMAFGVAYANYIVLGNLLQFFRTRTRRTIRPPELIRARASRGRQDFGNSGSDDKDLPPEEFISREVDPILDKISQHGIQSLTERERRILEMARSKMNRR
ncbi:MAG: rhomboid family intramembrane serine protease [Verrucomicrobiia bacterium]